MVRECVAPRLVTGLGLAIVGRALAERRRAVDRHHDGRVAAVGTAVAGPLRAELRAADYARDIGRVAGGRSDLRLPRAPAARLELWLRNDGADTVAIAIGEPAAAAAPGSCYTLVDDAGRRYPALAARWDRRPGEPDWDAGRLLPGWGAAIAIHFPGIPAEAGALSLLVGCLAAGDEPIGTLHLAVPLP